MKVTDLETYLVDTRGLIKWVFVKLATDEGLVGYGEAGNAFRERAQAAAIQELKPLVVGRDPFEIRPFWTQAYKTHLDVRGPSSLHVSALGAIEVALWDIVGKALHAPVYNLLGGKCRDRVRAYLHAQVWGGAVEPGPEVYVELARARVAEGFSAIKFDPFWFTAPTDANIGRDELRRVVRIVEAVRKAVGDQVDVGIEFHAKFNTPAAIRIGQALEEFDPFFIEEPTGSEDLEALRLVADNLRAPVASGERLVTRYAFKPMIDRHAADILQVDPGRAGGLLESRIVADMAEVALMPVLVHQPYGPIYDAMAVQLAAMIPNLLAVEWPKYYYAVEPPDLRIQLVKEPLTVEQGHVHVPTKPGIGVELDEVALQRYKVEW
ncbi:MAG TPA: mandelate racemase/muconate lactonizing enzyme family protein [Candidatus Methylomirabilis sp.]|nr:mandelate racemase/muconate lactonizing enzyme family protein [Candidatus Methylomirabilis sp.]